MTPQEIREQIATIEAAIPAAEAASKKAEAQKVLAYQKFLAAEEVAGSDQVVINGAWSKYIAAGEPATTAGKELQDMHEAISCLEVNLSDSLNEGWEAFVSVPDVIYGHGNKEFWKPIKFSERGDYSITRKKGESPGRTNDVSNN